MDRIDVQQSGGFPLETDTLDFLQNSYSLLNSLGFIAGNMTILTGCHESGSGVTNGTVFINGEVLPFEGGVKQERVVVLETQETRFFENGEEKIVYKKRFAKFGSGHGSIAWSNFVRVTTNAVLSGLLARVEKLEKYCKPFTHGGSYVLWNRPASEIPTGWEEATEFQGRLPIGFKESDSDFDAVGKTGGVKSVSLTEANNGPHFHSGTAQSAGQHSHTYIKGVPYGRSGKDNGSFEFWNGSTVSTSSSGAHSHTLSINTSGSGVPFSVVNPYRIVLFIKPIID
ncbi:MAG: hypothetical protein WCY77_10320 [Weeksellaceae bacterium]